MLKKCEEKEKEAGVGAQHFEHALNSLEEKCKKETDEKVSIANELKKVCGTSRVHRVFFFSVFAYWSKFVQNFLAFYESCLKIFTLLRAHFRRKQPWANRSVFVENSSRLLNRSTPKV